jgi:hypothetical protein
MLIRVSTSRHGVIATNTEAGVPPGICSCGLAVPLAASFSRTASISRGAVASQDKGAGQFFSGAGSTACAQPMTVAQLSTNNWDANPEYPRISISPSLDTYVCEK